MNSKDALVKFWFKKADNDIKNIENNLCANEIPTDTICFHAQQAIEKYLKGSLIYFEKEISKTHDLIKLLNDLNNYIPEINIYKDELENISGYGVEVRYPDNFYEPTLSEAKKTYEIVLAIKKIIQKNIKF